MRIGTLSEKYEGGGAGTISTGEGDAGGVSYGTYQLATNTGSAAAFVEWLEERSDYGKGYGEFLAKDEPGSLEFSSQWTYLADTDPEGFAALQDEYVKPSYYDAACEVAEKRGGGEVGKWGRTWRRVPRERSGRENRNSADDRS